MGKQEIRVSVDSGKYTFVIPADDYRVSILRYGEPWHGPQSEASNALFSMMAELDAARVVLQAARQAVNVPTLRRKEFLQEALALHDRLVDDREPPSAWCGGAQVEPAASADESPLTYWKNGTKLIEECLAKARKADPGDVPFPLVGDEARLWHSAQATAYQHALEMMGWTPRITEP